jgi:polyisoprenoid-binding protein YceI
MRKTSRIVLVFATTALLIGCPDPGAGKVKAKTGPAKGDTAAKGKKGDKKAAAPAGGGEKLSFDSAGGGLEWTAAKVTNTHKGGFKMFSGTIDLVGGKAEGSSVNAEIDLSSLFADNPKLEGHLKSPDFFDIGKFAKGTFKSTSVKAGGEGGASHTVTGDLSFQGVTKSISFPATIKVATNEVSATAEFAISRKDWGVKYKGKPDDLIKDAVAIKLSLKAGRKAAPAPAAAAPPAAGAGGDAAAKKPLGSK